MKRKRKFLKGAYFAYCQWCRWDGHCNLRHYQFLGMKPAEKIDDSPYPGHEDLNWHLSIFQKNSERGMCCGRIYEIESIYCPLQCECGTVISSLTFSANMGTGFCAKFRPNEKGKERMRIADKISKEKNVKISEIDLDELCPSDPDYDAVMTY